MGLCTWKSRKSGKKVVEKVVVEEEEVVEEVVIEKVLVEEVENIFTPLWGLYLLEGEIFKRGFLYTEFLHDNFP